MKQGWEIKKLGDVCTIKGRIGFRGYTRNDLVHQGEGAITLSPSNITNDVLLFDKCQYISWFKYEESPEIQVFEGDVIYAKTASVGKVALVKYLPEKATINPQFVVFKKILCSPSYLYYAVRGEGFKQQISQITNGVAIPTVSQSNMANLRIPVPTREEQERIVGELDCLSGIIENKRAQLRELDALAQSIFYTMFGDPITNDKGWETKKLPDICSIISTGITYKPENVADEGTIVLRSGNIQNSRFVLDDIVRINMPLKESQYVQQNDILMCSRNGSARLVGKVALIPNTTERMSWGAFMTIIRTEFYYFLYQYFQLPAFRQQLIKTKTSTVNQITIGMLKDISVPFPPILLQQQFAEKIENIERQKELIKQSIKETEDLFNSRMDYYFN